MDAPLTYWVVGFVARPRAHWWDWLYFGPYRHVVAFRFDPTTMHWQMFDWSVTGFDVVSLTRSEAADAWVSIRMAGGALVKWTASKRSPPRLCWPSYCVPVIGHVIGVGLPVRSPLELMGALLLGGGCRFLDEVKPEPGASTWEACSAPNHPALTHR
jgi:hypothetical protein